MSLEGVPTKVEDLPFPAFTLVADVNDDITKRERNYLNRYIHEGTLIAYRLRRYTIEDITIDDQVFATMCGKTMQQIVRRFPYNYSTSSEFVDFLRDYTHLEPPWFEHKIAKWNGMIDTPFTETLTNIGMGHTFNMIDQSKLLHDDRISKDFLYTYNTSKPITYPWKTSADDGKGFEISFRTNVMIQGCYNVDSYIIHPPNELPVNGEIIRIEDWSATEVSLTPTIVKTDQDMQAFDVDIRKCYFNDERKLKYFKVYTEKNCELECLSEISKS
ncbi:pickpocket protein 28-like [Chironomus tepperi]|uniref:pickpocket protein 28-like n=1 Tax=Chironomus tepperi TaxID=113505 RepID=UPI00391F2323